MTDPLYLKTGNAREQHYFYQNDHLGTPQKLMSTTGAIVWDARYEAFGQATPIPLLPGVQSVDNPLRFAGQYHDPETSWHYNWHRYYSPELGRYITSDPIGLQGGLNTYAYVGGNPISRVDAYGLKWYEFWNWFKEKKEGDEIACDTKPFIMKSDGQRNASNYSKCWHEMMNGDPKDIYHPPSGTLDPNENMHRQAWQNLLTARNIVDRINLIRSLNGIHKPIEWLSENGVQFSNDLYNEAEGAADKIKEECKDRECKLKCMSAVPEDHPCVNYAPLMCYPAPR
jgi:RHS repeat-associated protein